MSVTDMLTVKASAGEWIDVTVPIRHEMVHYPGDPAVELVHTKHLDRGDPATVSRLSLGVHTGTHVDSPVHFISGAPGVDSIPIDAMIGPARIVEIRDKEVCAREDLAAFDIAFGERIVLRTDNSERCSNANVFIEDYAHLDAGAARLLAEQRVRMVGIDYLSIGRDKEGAEVHRILLAAGIVVVEGLNLSQVEPGFYDIVCMPLRILDADGAPARVVVRRREGRPSDRETATAGARMRAAIVVPKDKTVRLVERSVPGHPGAAQVLLRIIEVGLCGTDREIAAFQYGAPPPGADELVLGHEALAEVVETGPEVVWARTGDLVIPTVRRPCASPRCPACRQERPDFCVTGEFTERGIVRADGFLCDYALEEERFLVAVPRAIEEVAVLVEPLSVAAKAANVFETIHSRFGFDIPRPRGLVLGAGPLGLLAGMVLQADGIETYVYSREAEDDPRAALVREFGANYISAGGAPLERLSERIGSIDVIFEAVGAPQVAFGVLPTLAANGILILTGVPAIKDPMPADLSRWMRDLVLNNQVIFGTVNAGRSAYQDAIRRLEQFMALFPGAVRSLVSRAPFDQVPALLARGRGIKDVVRVAA